MTLLKPRWEKVAQNLFAGMNQTDALIDAGYSIKSAAKNSTTILRNNKKIQARIAELQAERRAALSVKEIMPLKERMETLSGVARSVIEMPVSAGQITQAISEMNKMEHVYELGGVRDVNVVFVIGKGYQAPQIIEATEQEGEEKLLESGDIEFPP